MADPYQGDSVQPAVPGIKGTFTGGPDGFPGDGVVGTSDSEFGFGVRGASKTSSGFIAGTDPTFSQHAGVYGQSDQQGVFGEGSTGAFGRSGREGGFGVRGEVNGAGAVAVQGHNFGTGGYAIRGESDAGDGFIGGIPDIWPGQHVGVFGRSDHLGVCGEGIRSGDKSTGVFGRSTNSQGFGVRGEVGVGRGVPDDPRHAAVAVGVQGQAWGTGIGVKAISDHGTAMVAESTSVLSATCSISNLGTGGMIEAESLGKNGNKIRVFEVGNAGNIYTVDNIVAVGDVWARGVKLGSDCALKTNFMDINKHQTLERLMSMPIRGWNYRTDPATVRHIGPTSQDFRAAFGLNGENEQQISSVDAHGIALAAIQGLNEKLESENVELRRALALLEARVAVVESARERN